VVTTCILEQFGCVSKSLGFSPRSCIMSWEEFMRDYNDSRDDDEVVVVGVKHAPRKRPPGSSLPRTSRHLLDVVGVKPAPRKRPPGPSRRRTSRHSNLVGVKPAPRKRPPSPSLPRTSLQIDLDSLSSTDFSLDSGDNSVNPAVFHDTEQFINPFATNRVLEFEIWGAGPSKLSCRRRNHFSRPHAAASPCPPAAAAANNATPRDDVSPSSTSSSARNPVSRFFNRFGATPPPFSDTKRKSKTKEEVPPMQAGLEMVKPLTLSNSLDLYRPEINAPQRTHILASIFGLSKTAANRWRVSYELFNKRRSIWQMVIDCVNSNRLVTCNATAFNAGDTNYGLSVEEWNLLTTNLKAHFQRNVFAQQLDDIRPLSNDNNDNAGMECPVCCERYHIKDVVFCGSDEGMHVLCRPCMNRYVMENVLTGGITSVPCANPSCKALFPAATVRTNLSDWDQMRRKEREEDRNSKVALAAKAVLSCLCGAVGVIEDDGGHMFTRSVACPGKDCSLVFCIDCGNEWHEGKACPPPKETVKWIQSKTKPCPNCHTPIEKNGGCDHMHCAPPGGCDHHFSYSTGENLRNQFT
jgi:hypothetical protein